MAEHDALSAAFKSSHYVQQFVLNDVKLTGRKLGTGSYGSVEELMYKQLVCAGKKLHEILVEPGNQGSRVVAGKYLQECQLMSSLCHPNITLFLGLCFLPGTRLPLLVMERLETSLDSFLSFMPKFSLGLKHSILRDVASGLVYLHESQPSVIHRDLTAKNVLLTSSLVAKITDMGNSRIIDMRSDRMSQTLSKVPGTLVYMPPEALDNRHRYGPPLDIFSFGHLAIYTITQKFPGDLLPSTYLDPDNMDQVRGRTELERRGDYIELLEQVIGRTHQALLHMVKQCLHNSPKQRPSAGELHTWLETRMWGKDGGDDSAGRLSLAQEMRVRLDTKSGTRTQLQEAEIAEELEAMSREIEELEAENKGKDESVLKSSQIQQRRNILQAFKTQHQRSEASFFRPRTSPNPPKKKYEDICEVVAFQPPSIDATASTGTISPKHQRQGVRVPSSISFMPKEVANNTPSDETWRERRFTVSTPVQIQKSFGPLESQSWYWGKISRDIISNSLQGKPDGAFLVRDSLIKPGEYVLMVRKAGSNKFIRIASSDGKYGLADPKVSTAEPVLGKFSSVVSLVDYFQQTSFVKYNCSFDVTLTYPLSRFELIVKDDDDYDELEDSTDEDSRSNIQTWFCKVDRVKASLMLRDKPDGTFLCRPTGSPTMLPNGALHTHTVDFMYKGVRHLKVMERDGKIGFSAPCSFSSLTELISHFSANSLVTYNKALDVTLKFPINTR